MPDSRLAEAFGVRGVLITRAASRLKEQWLKLRPFQVPAGSTSGSAARETAIKGPAWRQQTPMMVGLPKPSRNSRCDHHPRVAAPVDRAPSAPSSSGLQPVGAKALTPCLSASTRSRSIAQILRLGLGPGHGFACLLARLRWWLPRGPCKSGRTTCCKSESKPAAPVRLGCIRRRSR